MTEQHSWTLGDRLISPKHLTLSPPKITHTRTHTHTHTHTRLTALFPGLPEWTGTRQVKPIWILLKQETVIGGGISWAICISLQADNHAITPLLSFLQAGCPSCRPTNSVKALKAYATHQRLLLKIKTYNIDTDLLSITDFLCNRKQCVVLSGEKLSWFSVLSGIPQGSIKGPLLFLIYINDLLELCAGEDHSSEIFLYADDSKICKVIHNQHDQQKLQSILNLMKKNWSDKWLLSSVRPILHVGEYSRVALQYWRIWYIGLCVSADTDTPTPLR